MRDGRFLPKLIEALGGIDNLLAGNRDALKRGESKYPTFYDISHVRHVIHWVMCRMARSGRMSVSDANKIIYRICYRYSGAPDRSWESAKLRGFGRLVTDDRGGFVESLPLYQVNSAGWKAIDEAKTERRAHSDTETRKTWIEGGDSYQTLIPCKWCSKPVLFSPAWKHRSESDVHCNGRDCRRMDYLQHKPQSRGGIDLTPRQRKEVGREAWDTQKAINYLLFKVKETKRASRANHDLR